jgi:uncharacterized protein (TIGR04222 family)
VFPFNLTGPQFLAFYAALCAVALVVYWRRLSSSEGESTAAAGARIEHLTADPYQIACLRGGQQEAVRLAIVNLFDRDLLANEGARISATRKARPAALRLALDRAIIARCASSPALPGELLADPAVRAAAAEIEQGLRHKGLLLNDDERRSRLNALRMVLLLLGGIALARIWQALSHGRGNVLFLIVLACLACGLAYRLTERRKSRAGKQALSNLGTLMRRLKERASRLVPGGATNEAMLLAAVFGIYALPAQAFPFVEQTFPQPKSQSSSGGDGSSGSDGGSCGGGGGGCGGCGGD